LVLAETLFRQVHARNRSLAELAIDLDRAAMQFDQPFRQRQTEADAVMLPGHAVADLAERRHGDRDLVGRHADAGILDTERDALVDTPLNLQPYLDAVRRELVRV